MAMMVYGMLIYHDGVGGWLCFSLVLSAVPTRASSRVKFQGSQEFRMLHLKNWRDGFHVAVMCINTLCFVTMATSHGWDKDCVYRT